MGKLPMSDATTGPLAARGTELLIVDASVAGAAILLGGRRDGVEVVHLAPGGGALAQIAAHLAGRGGIAALHVLSHGEPGALLLAGERIDAAALAAGGDALAGIAEALARNATVTLYGCSVAAGSAGIRFLDALEAALGVEVAASSGPVGALALGGGWTLRGRDGTAVEPVFAAAARAAYPGLLTVFDHILHDGADIFNGGPGNQFFSVPGFNFFNPLEDILDGGSGFDTIVISATLTITLGQSLLGFEAITITAGTVVIIADDTVTIDQNLTVDSSASPDTVSLDFAAETDGTLTFLGGGGADTVTGGAGNDTLSGGGGADQLSGRAGKDLLVGGAGNDVLAGGDGDDVMTGGAGNDSFTGSSADHNNDTISDFAVGDTIVVTGSDLTGTLNGATASGSISLGGGSTLTLTGITASSGTFAATFGGGNTSITLVAPSSGSSGLAVSDTGGDTTGGDRTISNSGSQPASAPVVQNTGNDGNVVIATLPPAVGISSEGPSAAQSGSTASDTLINAIDVLNAPGESGSISSTQGFLNTLSPTTPMDIRTIVPTVNPGITTDDPIMFTGSAGGQVEAFVIDMRTISGKTLQVNNIEFVSIIGPAHVTGGAGNNYAVGDDNAQFMSLGAGDDTLYGGGGSDTIGSADGNDVLYGNQADDTVVGGHGQDTLFGGQDADIAYGNPGDDVLYGNLGSDTLYGGQGNDLLYGGQSGSGTDLLVGGEGNDTLNGGEGADSLTGGGGSDLFVVAGSGGADTVTDFDGAGGDRVQIAANANGTTIDSFAELQAAATDIADGAVVIALGAGNTVKLMGVATAQMQADWFVFS